MKECVICVRNLLFCAKIIAETKKDNPVFYNNDRIYMINYEEENVYDF